MTNNIFQLSCYYNEIEANRNFILLNLVFENGIHARRVCYSSFRTGRRGAKITIGGPLLWFSVPRTNALKKCRHEQVE